MSWVAVGSAAVGVVGSVVSSSSAARGQGNAADAATDEQRRQHDLARSDQEPWRQAGANALGNLTNLAGQFGRAPTAADVMGQPGYQFGLDQGMNALEGRAAAQGGLYSGAAGKGLTRYANDYATTKYADAFNQKQAAENAIWNRYSSLSGNGQTAANQLGALGQNYANQVGQIGMNNANAQGAATISQGNALQGALNQGVSWWNNRPQQPATTPYVSPGYSSQGWGGQTYDPSTGMTLFAEGGPVQKFGWGGAVNWRGPQEMTGEQPVAQTSFYGPKTPAFAPPPGKMPDMPPTQQPVAQPLTQPMQQPMDAAPSVPMQAPMQQPMQPQGPWYEHNPEQTGQSFDQWRTAMGGWMQPNQLQGYADGGRVEPKIGTRSPLPMGTAGGLSPNALMLLIEAQRMQQMRQPMIGSIDPRIALERRLREAGEFSVGGQVQGPGGPRDDMIPARLSAGEHVMDTASVNAFGGGDNGAGQMRLNKLRAMLKGQ